MPGQTVPDSKSNATRPQRSRTREPYRHHPLIHGSDNERSQSSEPRRPKRQRSISQHHISNDSRDIYQQRIVHGPQSREPRRPIRQNSISERHFSDDIRNIYQQRRNRGPQDRMSPEHRPSRNSINSHGSHDHGSNDNDSMGQRDVAWNGSARGRAVMARVINTPELLENILIFLPPTDLLLRAARAQKYFQHVINTTPSLQKKLFRAPDHDSRVTMLTPFSLCGRPLRPSYEPFDSGPPNRIYSNQIIYLYTMEQLTLGRLLRLRSYATLQQVLLTQPPTPETIIVLKGFPPERPHTGPHKARMLVQSTAEIGVTIGDVFDTAYGFLRSETFRVLDLPPTRWRFELEVWHTILTSHTETEPDWENALKVSKRANIDDLDLQQQAF